MDIREISREGLTLVGIKVVGRRQELSHRAPLAWLELMRRLEEVRNRVHPELFYGVFREADQLADTGDGVHTYWVATEVTRAQTVPEGMVTLTLPAQRYAMASCKGGAERIEATYLGLFRWLREGGRRTREDGYGFELYDVRRQRPTPPYDAFDYDVYKPLA